MTFLTESRQAFGAARTAIGFGLGLLERWHEHRQHRQTAAMLHALTDRELRDIGLLRCQIDTIYGPVAPGA